MGDGKRYAKFQENLFSGNEIKSIFMPSTFSQRPILLFSCNMQQQIILKRIF